MPSKSEKIIRKFSADLGLGKGLPIFWHLGRRNFGDDINPWFYRQLSGDNFWQRTSKPHILGIGSIAEKMTPHSRVAGSGFIRPLARSEVVRPHSCFSLRGELSAEILGFAPQYYGDPMSLINLILPLDGSQKRPVLGIVPHVNELGSAIWNRFRNRDDVVVIDVRKNPVEVVREIASCSHIASQSLHGLVVADAYEIPNAWIEPADSMMGADFKFNDYFTSVDHAKDKITIQDFLGDVACANYQYARLKAPKEQYLAALKQFLLSQQKDADLYR